MKKLIFFFLLLFSFAFVFANTAKTESLSLEKITFNSIQDTIKPVNIIAET